MIPPALSIDGLSVAFRQRHADIPAVREVSLAVEAGECVGIVGESGSGKTQVFMAAMGLLAGNSSVSGRVRFEGEDILGVPSAQLNRVRGSKLTMIFQDPMTSMTPHLKIGTQLAEVLVRHAGKSWSEARAAARRMLERVRIPEPARRLSQYPHELSGGLRQRVMIGMSLLCQPKLLIADEPTTALDVTVQAQIIDLLRAMREEVGMALVLISHDLAVVGELADRILVMYAGRIVESAGAAQLYHQPLHPYTAALLKCIPSLSGPRLERLPTLAGQPPRPGDSTEGCAFAPRCPRAAERCRIERPLLQDAVGGAKVACHYPLPQ
ncbi:MAG TPA: ABC transporter ATP-binding protein [Steroidobacteraceae bacterium]|nr:ABC transporter ATP-binding protein [Steroidobacteraceae bacterium]